MLTLLAMTVDGQIRRTTDRSFFMGSANAVRIRQQCSCIDLNKNETRSLAHIAPSRRHLPVHGAQLCAAYFCVPRCQLDTSFFLLSLIKALTDPHSFSTLHRQPLLFDFCLWKYIQRFLAFIAY